MSKLTLLITCLLVMVLLITGCSWKNYFAPNDGKTFNHPPVPADQPSTDSDLDKKRTQTDTGIQVVTNPDIIPVLVNKQNKLPDNYNPSDLVDPDIPFIFEKKLDKRKMRAKAGAAIEKLFARAKQDGVSLLGVSAFRSREEQASLFNHYVHTDGYEAAITYSAVPGTSEHETGLAIDVTGGNGECAAEDCFAGTPEADWLEDHAADYGFIIRYPKGKDTITGYQYEPWHLRYVGKAIAKEIMTRGITLEEYLSTAPVNN
ncbi:D-alanyl-D-alanine carboxypeptidase family protein [Bacillus sp. S3]|uniref:M15 family metallopeptidase n=1 Tax=Bacillus sp. S3 TaxID=486398 RepID=UPI00118CF4C5|nr:M15 family metallopeptidase [Bacillus sp. S3]QCJ45312.1 D-alanyl-D-alanine carboxypeptidase family protein [Bacillus sp. S3]